MGVFFFIVIILFVWLLPLIIAISVAGSRSDALSRRLDKLERQIRELSGEPEKTLPAPETAKPSVPATENEPSTPATPPQAATLPPPAVPAKIPPAKPATPFSEKLREWKILPPRDMSVETVVMQWWAPRIGGLLALFFLGFVYHRFPD